ncbi:hypothetical protein C8R46DRAFT_936258 [Mycena filopes]|nr:hypothetical protein C8R46DRAFT_936258 [Mycena filopes]
MPNPVDDSPVGPGEIALRPDTDPSTPVQAPQAPSGLRKFRRRALYVTVVCCTLLLVAFREHPPSVGRPIDELAYDSIADDPRLEPYQRPEDADYCADWVSGPDDLSSASFELSSSADLAFFLSRGPVAGHLSVIPTPNYSRGAIEVNVTTHSHGRQRARACQMGQGKGVLLWAEPRHPHDDPQRDVRVNITVALPTGVRNYKDLTTDLPMFSHNLALAFDLWSPTSFDVIRLKSANAGIDFGSLLSHTALIQTSNAPVRGFFGGVELGIQTSNGPIESTAMMFGAREGSESKLTLKTSDAEIKSLLSIGSDFKRNTLRGTFRTSNAQVTVDAPRIDADDARLFLEAATSVAPAIVRVAAEFEGTYDLRTSGVGRAEVVAAADVEDPLGKGRRRTVVRERTGQRAQGRVYWSRGPDEEPAQGGSVKVTTSVSAVKLIL